jgi:hypothetical protein
MDLDPPPLPQQLPNWKPLSPQTPTKSKLNPNARPFLPSVPTIAASQVQPVAPAPPVTQTFPVTAHFFANVTNHLCQAEYRATEMEQGLRDCKQLNDQIQAEVKDDQKRIGELCWLYDQVDAAEKQQRLLQSKVTGLAKERSTQAISRIQKDLSSQVNKATEAIAKVKSQVDRQGGEFSSDVGQLKKTVNEIQVNQAVDKASAIKDTMEVRKAVFTEYRDRFNCIENALRLMHAQVKKNSTPQNSRPAFGNRWGNNPHWGQRGSYLAGTL